MIQSFGKLGSNGWHHEDSGADLLSPGVLTREQFYPMPARSPYHRLLFAVLEDAIICFQQGVQASNVHRRRLFHEAKHWLFDAESGGFMSCPMVCESLGIDLVALRRYLHEWHRKIKAGQNAPRQASAISPSQVESIEGKEGNETFTSCTNRTTSHGRFARRSVHSNFGKRRGRWL